MAAKTKSDTVISSVKVIKDKFWHFVLTLSSAVNISQSTSSVRRELSKTPYDDWEESVSTALRFNSKKSFHNPPIFTNRKDPIIEQLWLKMQSKLKLNRERYPDNNTPICYAKNCCGGKALKHLQPQLLVDSLIPFEIIEELFTKLEKV